MAKKKRKLSKESLRKLRQRIARRNFGLNKKAQAGGRSKNVARKKRRMSRRSKGGTIAKFGGVFLYGATREAISNRLAPITQRIPLGGISDEVGMLTALWLGKKFVFKRAGILRDMATDGMKLEVARLGEAVVNGELGLGIFGSSSKNGVQPATVIG